MFNTNIELYDCTARESPSVIVQLGIALPNCAVRESPYIFVQLGNHPAQLCSYGLDRFLRITEEHSQAQLC